MQTTAQRSWWSGSIKINISAINTIIFNKWLRKNLGLWSKISKLFTYSKIALPLNGVTLPTNSQNNAALLLETARNAEKGMVFMMKISQPNRSP